MAEVGCSKQCLPEQKGEDPASRDGVDTASTDGQYSESRDGVDTASTDGQYPESRDGQYPESRDGVDPESRDGVDPASMDGVDPEPKDEHSREDHSLSDDDEEGREGRGQDLFARYYPHRTDEYWRPSFPINLSADKDNVRWQYKPDPCPYMDDNGICPFSDTCKFHHDEPEDPYFHNNDGTIPLFKTADIFNGFEDLPAKCFYCRSIMTDPIMTSCTHYFCTECIDKEEPMRCWVCGSFPIVILPPPEKLLQLLEKIRMIEEQIRLAVERRRKEMMEAQSNENTSGAEDLNFSCAPEDDDDDDGIKLKKFQLMKRKPKRDENEMDKDLC